MIKRVLLIDDDKDEHEIFSHALNKYNSNLSCLTAISCSEGFFSCQRTKTGRDIFRHEYAKYEWHSMFKETKNSRIFKNYSNLYLQRCNLFRKRKDCI